MVERVGVASLDTEVSVIHLGVGGSANSRDTIVGDLDIKAAANTAVATRGLHNSIRWRCVDAVGVRNRASRTVVHASAAGDAGAVRKTRGRTKDEVR